MEDEWKSGGREEWAVGHLNEMYVSDVEEYEAWREFKL